MAHRRRSFPVARMKRSKVWDLGPGGDDLATYDSIGISTTSSNIFGSGITPVVGGGELTVLRTRGFLQLHLLTASGQGQGFNYAAGIAVASAAAFAVGSTAVPMPFDEVGWGGWLWHMTGKVSSPIDTLGVGSLLDGIAIQPRFEIDSKAMRKFGFDDVVYAAIQVAEVGTATMNATLVTRVLLQEANG